MLRTLLFPIARFALWVFFRHIDVRGRSDLPRNRRLIFVANHPNVMLDSLLVAAFSPGHPLFLGKSTLFKNRLYAFLLRHLGVIPVSRTQDRGSRMARNQDMLRTSCQSLKDGQPLALFPEGISHAGLRVLPLKSGAARIALRVEDEMDGHAEICIIPVGLAYSDPSLFRSEVAIHFGQPVEVAPFLDAYRTNRQSGSHALTDLVHQRLAALTWHVENPDLETVVRDLSAVYGDEVLRQIPDAPETSNQLRAGQEIIQAVEHFANSRPDLVADIGPRLRRHRRKLHRLGLSPAQPSQSSRLHLLFGLLLAPFFVYGFLNNALPYFLPRLFVRPHRQSPELIGTVKLAIGSAAFPLYYLIRTGVAGLLWGWPNAFIYGCTLPLSGLFALFYSEHFLERWPLWQSIMRPGRRRYYLRRIAQERDRLLADIEAVKNRYLSRSV
jgi:glycerol-3-phosphate O-acyltransferase / dihydroxyacetone phosphate acyltransferase